MSTLTQVAQPRAGGRRQLWIAAALGLVAAVLVLVLLNDSGRKDGTSAPTTSVLVASQQIAAGQKISESMLTTKAIPETAVTQDAFTDTSAAIGQVARYPLEKGEQINPSRLVPAAKFQTLSAQIPAGMRGMTIPVRIDRTPAALIAPGDFVDVIVSVETTVLQGQPAGPATTSNNDKPRGAATILQNLQVLTVERNYVDTGVVYDSSTRGEPPADKDKITFVTLAVSPDQAQLLWLAQDKAEDDGVTIVLRPFGDNELVPLAPITEPLNLR